MFTTAILTIPTVVLPLLISSPTRDCQLGRVGDPAAGEQALIALEVAVDDYVVLRRRLERASPLAWPISDLEQMEMAAEELRTALRDARPQALPGNLFTPEVADILRFRIETALREQAYDLAAMMSPGEGGSREPWKPVVNQPLPWATSGTVWPLFRALPELPSELEYRLFGRDLVTT